MAGSVVNGLLAYAYVALGTRHFGAAAFAPVSIVWSIWSIGVAVLTFPFQHRVIHLIRTGATEATQRRDLRRLTLTATAVASATVIVSWIPRAALFGSTAATYPLVSGLVVLGSAVLGMLRGGLAGRGRHSSVAVSLGLETAVRLGLGAVVVLLDGSLAAYTWTLVTGVLIVAMWPRALAASAPQSTNATANTSLGHYLVSVATGSVLAQLALTGGPVVLSLLGGTPAAVTALFTTLAVARAPYLIATGGAVRTMTDLADLMARGDTETLRATATRFVVGPSLTAAVVGAVSWPLGPPVLRLVFGPEAALYGPQTAAVAAGSLLAVGTLLVTLTLIAMQRTTGITVAWITSAAVFGGIVAVPWGADLDRVIAGFVASEASALFLLRAWVGPRSQTSR